MSLNFRHLQYFWAVAREGSLTRAARRLGVTAQTISGQIRLLEAHLGKALFAPQGRGLVLTQAGRVALGFADQIFQLGEQLEEAVGDCDAQRSLRFTVGISDGLPKLLAYGLLDAALSGLPALRLVCQEGEFDDLLADLMLHRLDVVLTDRPVAPGRGLGVYSHALGEDHLAFFATPDLAARYRPGFPASLHQAPLLLPTRDSAVRERLDTWFEAGNVRPDVVGEFEDSALLQTFGRTGRGLFPAPAGLQGVVAAQLGAELVGELPELTEQYFAISHERRISHPAVEALRNLSLGDFWAGRQAAPAADLPVLRD